MPHMYVPGWIGHWSVWTEVADHRMNPQRCCQPPEYAMKEISIKNTVTLW